MPTELKVPEVGESITEVTISKWIKSDGDFVEIDDPVCELESEKATFELNAESSGILKTKVAEGEAIEIGTVIGYIEENGEKTGTEEKAEDGEGEKPEKQERPPESGKSPSREKKESTTEEMNEMKVPAVGESITEVTISSWIRKDGEKVEIDDVIAEIDSDKATFELTAEANGILHHVAAEGETLEIGALICRIEETGAEAPVQTKKEEEEPEEAEREKSGEKEEQKEKITTESYAKGYPSPAAAKLMAEKGIRPEDVEGSGPGGRIIKEDVREARKPEGKPAPQVPEKKEEPRESKPRQRQERKEKLSQLRKTVSRRLVSVKNETAMLTTFNEVNMMPIMELRKKYKEKFKEKYDINLGFMSFFAKACCIALQEWPSVNAKIDGDEIVFHEYVDISIAVSSPKGLVVPVVRDAQDLSFAAIEKEVLRLATKARENKLSIEEMTGGTFTITNGGVFGSMMSTPIINAPQSAILGMHNIVERPVVEQGEIVVRPIMYVALSYDHRIIDGRESVSFLVRIKELLEDPSRILLEI
jgi:2-oxoglutarate dehydrogenase E2 component (dihydrolipoamide succinyltransferase)